MNWEHTEDPVFNNHRFLPKCSPLFQLALSAQGSEGRQLTCRLKHLYAVMFLLLLVAPAAQPSENTCEIEGEISVARYLISGSETHTTYTFLAWIKEGRWIIRTIPLVPKGPDAMEKYNEVGTDGSNTFGITVFNPEYDNTKGIRRMLEKIETRVQNPKGQSAKDLKGLESLQRQMKNALTSGKGDAINQAVGVIRPLPFPMYEPDLVTPVWLAYCSGSYLDEVNNERLPAVWPSTHWSQNYSNNTAKVTVQREQAPPYLPVHVAFLNEGTYLQTQDNNLVSKSLPFPFDKGYTSAVYHVTATTNYKGLTLPLAFKLTRHGARTNATNNSDVRLMESIEGVTKKIRVPCLKTNFVPDLPVNTALQDYRLLPGQKPNAVQYVAKPGPWMTTTNVSELNNYQKELRAKAALKKKQKRILFSAGIGVLAVLPILGYYLMSRHKKNPNTEKQNQNPGENI